MSTDISVYTDPGVYDQEVLNPSALAMSPVANLLAIVGIAPRQRRVANEPVTRGQVNDEVMTVAGTPPYTATLVNRCNRLKSTTLIVRNTTDEMPDDAYNFLPATITGLDILTAGVVVGAGTFITLNMDGKGWISILLPNGGAVTPAQMAAAINTQLGASPLYGVGYNAVATVIAGAPLNSKIVLLSPSTTNASDIRFIATPVDTPTYTTDYTLTAFGVVTPWAAPTVVQIVAAYWTATATWKIDYVSLNTLLDPLANSNIYEIERLGVYAGVTTYVTPADYILNTNSIDWSANTQAVLTGVAGPYNTTANNKFLISLNGLAALTITCTAGAAVTAATLATEINQALIASSAYGPLYGAVAANVAGTLRLTCPSPFVDHPATRGASSTIELFDLPLNGCLVVFGIAIASLPYLTSGLSTEPYFGSIYFATYTYTRPTTDYNNASSTTQLFERDTDALDYTGQLTLANIATNQLGMASVIAFENDSPRVLLIQVNDSTMPGFPTINQFKAAIDAAKNNSDITDIVALDTRSAVQTYLMDHCTGQSSLLEQNYRHGWYGMARQTAVGGKDTPNTLVYCAQVTLQVPPDSPGRGRMNLLAPPNVSKTFTLYDKSEKTVDLNSTYLAVAAASRKCSFVSVAQTLLRRTIVGFDLDTFQVYLKQERKTLASNGVNVVTLTGSRLVFTDPVTTEQGAGNVPAFIEPSTMAQKDRVVRFVDSTVDTNLVGVVPEDLADFIADVKGYIALALRGLIEAGDCGRYKNSDGSVRDINLNTDIQVYQSATDPRTFRFRYWFNLRYPAKRFFGEHSVDNPFFQAA